VIASSSFEKLQNNSPVVGYQAAASPRRQAGSSPVRSVATIHHAAGRDLAVMAAILLVGIVAYTQLPVSALPEVDYPTIQVVTFYPGASPVVMATTVTAPLERQFGQLQGSAR